VLGGLQTLTAGVVAIIAGVLYEHAGRTTAYAFAATLMVVFVAVGALLARPAWDLRGQVGELDAADALVGPEVPGMPTAV
jgi:hypothetical protein